MDSDTKMYYYMCQAAMLCFYVVACATAQTHIGLGVVFLLMALTLVVTADMVKEMARGCETANR